MPLECAPSVPTAVDGDDNPRSTSDPSFSIPHFVSTSSKRRASRAATRLARASIRSRYTGTVAPGRISTIHVSGSSDKAAIDFESQKHTNAKDKNEKIDLGTPADLMDEEDVVEEVSTVLAANDAAEEKARRRAAFGYGGGRRRNKRRIRGVLEETIGLTDLARYHEKGDNLSEDFFDAVDAAAWGRMQHNKSVARSQEKNVAVVAFGFDSVINPAHGVEDKGKKSSDIQLVLLRSSDITPGLAVKEDPLGLALGGETTAQFAALQESKRGFREADVKNGSFGGRKGKTSTNVRRSSFRATFGFRA